MFEYLIGSIEVQNLTYSILNLDLTNLIPLSD